MSLSQHIHHCFTNMTPDLDIFCNDGAVLIKRQLPVLTDSNML